MAESKHPFLFFPNSFNVDSIYSISFILTLTASCCAVFYNCQPGTANDLKTEADVTTNKIEIPNSSEGAFLYLILIVIPSTKIA